MTDQFQDSQLITRQKTDMQHEQLGALPSLSSRAMFWRPKYLQVSDWLDHLPFAFWLVDSIQPKVTVELGVAAGASYFAFCQAVDKLSIDGRCYAIDHWSGRGQTAQFEELKAYNSTQYEEFSKILDQDYATAASLFLPGSVDLLHFNCAQPDFDVVALYQLWQPCLSSHSVILLHHSQEHHLHAVAALKKHLTTQHQHFEFLQQHGLLVVMFKQSPSESFNRLMAIRPGEKTFEIVQNVFSRLGKACSETVQADVAKSQVRQVSSQLQDAKAKLGLSEQRITELLANLNNHQQWLSARQTEANQLAATLKRTELQKVEEQTALQQRITTLESLRVELKSEVENLFDHVKQLSSDKNQLTLDMVERDAEFKLLQQQLIQKNDHCKTVETELQQAHQLFQDTQRQLQVQATDLARVNNDLAEMTRLAESYRLQCIEHQKELEQEKAEIVNFKQQTSKQTTNLNKLNDDLKQRLEQASQVERRFEQQLEIHKQNLEKQSHEMMQIRQQLEATSQVELQYQQQADTYQHELAEVKQLADAYQHELAQVKQQADAYQHELAQVKQQADAYQHELVQVKQQAEQQLLTTTHNIHHQFDIELQQQKDLLAQSYRELAELSHLLQTEQIQQAQIKARLNQELQIQQIKNNAVKASISWKITSPLRWITSLLTDKDVLRRRLATQQLLIQQSGLFDENWYLQQYPDVVSSDITPLEHYILFGGFEGRRPNPDFDSGFYLVQYPDVVDAGLNPLVHYLKFGRTEQRLTSINVQ